MKDLFFSLLMIVTPFFGAIFLLSFRTAIKKGRLVLRGKEMNDPPTVYDRVKDPAGFKRMCALALALFFGCVLLFTISAAMLACHRLGYCLR